jgi:hypothetical protein
MRAVRGDEARVKVHSGQLIRRENQIGARLVQPGGLSYLTKGYLSLSEVGNRKEDRHARS